MTEESLFLAALDRPDPADRQKFLDDACAGDPALRRRVDVLLAAFAAGKDRLEPPGGDDTRTALGPAPTADYQPGPEPGTVVAGRYTLLEKVGEGGMGEVWVARQTQPVTRKVALKLIKPGMDSRLVLARFEAERQALALMDHPNIAKVLDGGLTGENRPFFVMELVNGRPLTEFCDAARLPPRERLELFVHVCRAVQHAHQKGVIHRDLKPSNVLVTLYDGRPVPKVIDFGVAKATGRKLTDESVSTQFGAVVGTFEYMAPEQAGLSALDVDTRADVYALGVILYELLTGLRPFDGPRLRKAALDEMIRILREEDPPRPSTRLSTDASLPSAAAVRGMEPRKLTALMRGELDWVVMKCLEKDRGRRYESAGGLARDVERYLADEPVEARPPSAGYRLRKFARRNRGPVAAAAVVLLVLLAGIAGTTWGLVRAERSRRDALAAQQAEADQRRAAEGQARQAASERDRARKAEAEATARKGEADEQADAARAVSEFLRADLLSQADVHEQADRDPEVNPGLTVREALDRAAARVGDRFRDRPRTQAAVRETIGRAYLGLGEPALAAPHLERAVALYRAAVGPDDPAALTVAAFLGASYAEAGRVPEAVALLEDVHRRARAAVGPEHRATLHAAHALAGAYRRADRPDDAIHLYEGVVRAEAARLGPTHRATLTARNNLAGAYEQADRLDLAVPLFEDLARVRRDVFGPDHPDTLMSLNNLGTAYWKADRPDRAVPLFEECLRRRRDRLGEDHPLTIRTRANLGVNYRDAGRLDEAVRELAGSLTQARRRPAPDVIGVPWVAGALMEAYTRAGRHAEAEPLFREALDRVRPKSGGGGLKTAQARAALGLNLLRQRKYADAEPVLRGCLAVRERADPDGWTTAYARSMLGEALLGQGRYAEAEPLLVAGADGLLARADRVPADARLERLGEAVDRLVRLYEGTGRPAEAAAWRARRPPEPGPAPRVVE